jgi:hypothetical protein
MELFAALIGIVAAFLFVFLCINVGTIRKNIQTLYLLEHLRAVREGLVTEDDKPILRTAKGQGHGDGSPVVSS